MALVASFFRFFFGQKWQDDITESPSWVFAQAALVPSPQQRGKPSSFSDPKVPCCGVTRGVVSGAGLFVVAAILPAKCWLCFSDPQGDEIVAEKSAKH